MGKRMPWIRSRRVSWFLSLPAFFVIGVGVILFPLPIPFGLVLILAGLGMLQMVNPRLSKRLWRGLKGWVGNSNGLGSRAFRAFGRDKANPIAPPKPHLRPQNTADATD